MWKLLFFILPCFLICFCSQARSYFFYLEWCLKISWWSLVVLDDLRLSDTLVKDLALAGGGHALSGAPNRIRNRRSYQLQTEPRPFNDEDASLRQDERDKNSPWTCLWQVLSGNFSARIRNLFTVRRVYQLSIVWLYSRQALPFHSESLVHIQQTSPRCLGCNEDIF